MRYEDSVLSSWKLPLPANYSDQLPGRMATADPLELYGIGVKGFCDAESTEILQCRLDALNFVERIVTLRRSGTRSKHPPDCAKLEANRNNLLSGAIQHV